MRTHTNELTLPQLPQAPHAELSSTRRAARFAALAAIATLAVIISGCNTTKGFGKDLEETGQNIDKAATNAKNN